MSDNERYMTEKMIEQHNQYKEALEDLVAYAIRGVCLHESTHRGGTIWEICDDCGEKWADDKGGLPPSARELPSVIKKAIEALNPQPQYEEVEVAVKVCPICNIVEKSAALRCYCAFGAKGTALIDSVVKYQKPIELKVKRREQMGNMLAAQTHFDKGHKLFAEWEE